MKHLARPASRPAHEAPCFHRSLTKPCAKKRTRLNIRHPNHQTLQNAHQTRRNAHQTRRNAHQTRRKAQSPPATRPDKKPTRPGEKPTRPGEKPARQGENSARQGENPPEKAKIPPDKAKTPPGNAKIPLHLRETNEVFQAENFDWTSVLFAPKTPAFLRFLLFLGGSALDAASVRG